MIKIRQASERGHAEHGWLDSYHTFSFAQFHDPQYMSFGHLRVINEDRVQPGEGFGTHSHQDMEIISYILDGALEHKDSVGNTSVMRPGDVQLLRAGTGITHSEYNHSSEEIVHFLQIWILPDQLGLPPAYAQRHYSAEQRRNVLRLLASCDERDDALQVHQDVALYATMLEPGKTVTHTLTDGRSAWVQVARGQVFLNDVQLSAGDGAAVRDETRLELTAGSSSELLMFDLRQT